METNTPPPDDVPRCNRCVHYFITHDPQFPYGCNAMNFKSYRQPIDDVIEASGKPCLYFQAKLPGRRPR
ncbi:MAG: hypothetical protein WC023_12970 [Rhodocyclaceae bacterium]|jgi:hypothetical protein